VDSITRRRKGIPGALITFTFYKITLADMQRGKKKQCSHLDGAFLPEKSSGSSCGGGDMGVLGQMWEVALTGIGAL
jgi:hypothetical protein